MLMQEAWVDRTDNCLVGESEVYEAFTDDVGKLFKSCQKDYGRCIGKVHFETKDKKVIDVGWLFLKRVKYQDSNDTYLQETWVTLHESKPVTTVEYHLKELKQ